MLGVTMKDKKELGWQEKCITMINETNEYESVQNEGDEVVATTITELESKRVSRMSRRETLQLKPSNQKILHFSESPKQYLKVKAKRLPKVTTSNVSNKRHFANSVEPGGFSSVKFKNA